MADNLTLTEQQELAAIEAELAKIQSSKQMPSSQSVSQQMTERLAALAKETPYIALEAGMASVGQKGGLPLAPVTFGLSVPVGGAIGGLAGYEAAMRAKGEEPTLRGRLMAAGMGAIPFGPEARLMGTAAKATVPEIAGAAAREAGYGLAVAQASKAAAGEGMLTPEEAGLTAGAMATGRTMAKMGEGAKVGRGSATYVGPSKEAADAAQQRAQRLEQDEALAAWQAVGGVTDPVQQSPGALTKEIELSAGGRTVVQQKLRKRNQVVVNDLSRTAGGFRSDEELTFDAISKRRLEAKEPYTEIATLSKDAEGLLKSVEAKRADAAAKWRKWSSDRELNRKSDPELLDAAKAANAAAEKSEDALEAYAKKHGSPDLYERFVQSRKQLSKLHVIDSALNRDSGNVDALTIAAIRDVAPEYMTEELRLIAQVANIQKQIMGEFVREAPASRGILGAIPSAAAASAFYAGQKLGGTPAAALASIAGYKGGQIAQNVGAEKVLQFITKPAFTGPDDYRLARSVASMLGAELPAPMNYQAAYGLPSYQTNVPSNLSLFLRQAGRATAVQNQ